MSAFVLLMFIACTGQSPDDTATGPAAKPPPPPPPGTTEDTVHTGGGSVSSTGDTAETTYIGPVWDCDNQPPFPTSYTTMNIDTEEDFDFDGEGYLIRQYGSDLLGTNFARVDKVLSGNIGSDISGIRVLADGSLVYADHSTASLWIVDTLGIKSVLLPNLTEPNGLAVDSNGLLYFSEFTANGQVSSVDPATSERQILFEDLSYPNGIEFSPDEQSIYVTVNPPGQKPRLYRMDKIADEWVGPEFIFEGANNTLLDTVTTDICGNIYTVDYRLTGTQATVWQITPDGVVSEFITLNGGQWPEFNAMRWGNGVTGWDRTTLYITNRREIFVVEVGLEGRWHPTTP